MIKKVNLAILILLLVPAVLFSSGEKPRFKKKEHAKLAGLIGGYAMAIDAYYEICLQKKL